MLQIKEYSKYYSIKDTLWLLMTGKTVFWTSFQCFRVILFYVCYSFSLYLDYIKNRITGDTVESTKKEGEEKEVLLININILL